MMTLKFNVKGNINIKRRIIVNGRETPASRRCRTTSARCTSMRWPAQTVSVTTPTLAVRRRGCIVNGREYASLDEMPEEIRKLYDAAMATVDAHGSVEFGAGEAHASAPAPLAGCCDPAAFDGANQVGGGGVNSTLKVVIAAIVILMLVGALYYLSHLAGKERRPAGSEQGWELKEGAILTTKPKRQSVSSGSPYEPVIGISRAVRMGQAIAVSGTAPIGQDGKTVGVGDPKAQARRCFEITKQALEKLGASLDDVIRTRVFLTRIEDWKVVAEVHGEYFRGIRPASTFVQVLTLR